MPSDFSADYSKRSDDELLLLASGRASLTTEAAVALDAELRRRNLTESDQHKYQRFVEHNEKREARRRRNKKIFGSWTDRGSWVDMFWSLLVISLISFTYLSLPSRYHMRSDWQEAAVHMMFASVFIAVCGTSWWRKADFWISLLLSSATHVLVVHAWVQRIGSLSRGSGKLAVLLGFVLFFGVYGLVRVLRRNLYGEDARSRS